MSTIASEPRTTKGAIRRMLALLGLLTAFQLCAPAANATALDELTNWLNTDGVGVVLASPGAPKVNPEAVALGRAIRTWTWSADYLAGDADADPVVSTDRWAASIAVQGEIMGGIVVDMSEGSENSPAVVWDVPFGQALTPNSMRIVHDRTLDAWFSLSEEAVRPLTPAAQEVLAGPLSVDLAQDFVRQWNGATDVATTSVQAPEPAEPNFVLVTALIMGGILTLLAVVVLLRKGDGRE